MKPDLRIVAMIPARGGSKGVPRKNLVEIGGRPLVEYSIEQAVATPAISEVIVSTDDSEIAEIASRMGVTVIDRPAEISGDEAPSESALLHALKFLLERDGRDPELVVFLQATSPLRPENAISEAIDQIITSRADSLFSACPQHGFVWRSGAESLESLTYDYKHRPRRQDAPEDFAENGSIYVFKPWVLRELGNRLGGRVAIYRMRTVHSFQVDTPDDIELMETLVRVLRNSVGNPGVDS